MFVTDQFVYLQLQKTGCTHIARLLSKLCSGEQIAKHNRLPANFASNGRMIIGTVRNPWEWYVSLWGYGCDGRGALYRRLRSPAWRETYANIDEPQLFRRWLYMVHDPNNRGDLGERYAESSASHFSGFYTYRYALLYLKNADVLYSSGDSRLVSAADLKTLIERDNVLDFTIRTEQLEEDLIKALNFCGVQLSEDQVDTIYSAERTNASSRTRPITCYYNADAIELVRVRDSVLVEKYGFPPPTLT